MALLAAAVSLIVPTAHAETGQQRPAVLPADVSEKGTEHTQTIHAIVHVVRAFDDENVMREQGRESDFVDPMADIETINLELILADLESINKRYFAT